MIDDLVAEFGRQHPLGERHADRVAEPLAGAARSSLQSRSRVRAPGAPPCGCRAGESASAHRASCRDSRVRCSKSVEQHAAVTVRDDKPVAVGPLRRQRIKAQELREQHTRRYRPYPSACRDGRISPARPRPWRGRGARRPYGEASGRAGRGAAARWPLGWSCSSRQDG